MTPPTNFFYSSSSSSSSSSSLKSASVIEKNLEFFVVVVCVCVCGFWLACSAPRHTHFPYFFCQHHEGGREGVGGGREGRREDDNG